MLVKSYQFTGINFGHFGQVVHYILKQSGRSYTKLSLGFTDASSSSNTSNQERFVFLDTVDGSFCKSEYQPSNL